MTTKANTFVNVLVNELCMVGFLGAGTMSMALAGVNVMESLLCAVPSYRNFTWIDCLNSGDPMSPVLSMAHRAKVTELAGAHTAI